MLKLQLILDSLIKGLMLVMVVVFIVAMFLLERPDLVSTLCVGSLIIFLLYFSKL